MSSIPENFPSDPFPAAVSGARPKLAARLVDGKFVVGMTQGERQVRYEICADLVQQLLAYCQRKQLGHPGGSREILLQRVDASVRRKGWDVSPIELTWVMQRVAELFRVDENHKQT